MAERKNPDVVDVAQIVHYSMQSNRTSAAKASGAVLSA